MAPIAGTWEEREQVRELYARYAFTIDYNRFEEWVRCFTEDGVFESPIFGLHQGSRGLLKFTAQYKESMGGAKVVGVPIILSKTPGEPRGRAPEFGEQTEIILTELLGYSWEDVARLHEARVI